MGEFRVGRTKHVVTDTGRHRTSARFLRGDTKVEAYFELSASVPFVTENVGDLWVTPALVMAMRHNLTLRLRDPISNARRDDLDVAQDIMSTWFPERMGKVEIKAPRGTPRSSDWSSRSALLERASRGGSSSFHTLVKNRGRVGALIYGFGLDVPQGHGVRSRSGGTPRPGGRPGERAAQPLLERRTSGEFSVVPT